VIIAEDLQWADTSSIGLMESLFRLAETQRILFINVFRPGHEETGDRIVQTIREKLPVYYVEIRIEPLNEQMSEALIFNMLNIGKLHHEIIAQIVEQAGGNPFFIEEVVRSLIDEGAVVINEGSFQVTEKIGTITIPNTINDVLMARIDRLDEETRNLVKIASVIGRNFFHRILSEVASTIEDIDSKLSYLKEIQLIREHRRKKEVEYLFKHVLTQEAAYDSILPLKRKKLHLSVARAIEKVFCERIHEFYGMLAYHCSRAEDLEKAEEYLIKAGEEALRSSASNEALNYYQRALNLYLKKSGNDANPEKVAMFEKNIAIALYNRGQYVHAVEYFDKALSYYWGRLPRHGILKIYRFLSALFHIIISLYLPALKFRKIPTDRNNEIIDLYSKKCEALAIINPKRFFIESLYFLEKVTKFDLKKLHFGIGMFMAASSLFSFTGFSFGISRKILNFSNKRIGQNDEKQLILYDLLETIHNYFEGNWKAIGEYDDLLVKKNLDMGKIYYASHHLFWHGLPSIYQGFLHTAGSIVNRLQDIYELYENDVAMLLKQTLNTYFLTECRILYDALNEIEKCIDFAQKANQGLSLLHMFSCRARIYILMGDIEEAKKSLRNADKIRRDVDSVPWQLSNFYKSELEYNLYRLEESIRTKNETESTQYRKMAIKSSKTLLKHSYKLAQNRTESYKLIGIYHWLRKNRKKALKWWNRSIKEGKQLGARLELSRTYFEVGKRLLEPETKCKKLNEIPAEQYLARARKLFKEMDLQWDLDELDRVARD
jgi:tetratricopeptide (TPR) repeat protein